MTKVFLFIRLDSFKKEKKKTYHMLMLFSTEWLFKKKLEITEQHFVAQDKTDVFKTCLWQNVPVTKVIKMFYYFGTNEHWYQIWVCPIGKCSLFWFTVVIELVNFRNTFNFGNFMEIVQYCFLKKSDLNMSCKTVPGLVYVSLLE